MKALGQNSSLCLVLEIDMYPPKEQEQSREVVGKTEFLKGRGCLSASALEKEGTTPRKGRATPRAKHCPKSKTRR